MNRPWGKYHRILYVLLGCAGPNREPTEQGVLAVGNFAIELMNLGELPMDDDEFQAIWTDVWLQQADDRGRGFEHLMQRAIHHATTLRREIDAITAQTIVAMGLMSVARADGQPTPQQMGYIMGCGQSLGVG